MTEPNDPLEPLIHRTLRQLPQRRAPRSLEMRVFAEIERRTSRAGRFNFMHWPLAGRAAFVLVCLAIAKLTLVATTWGTEHVLAVFRLIPLDWAIGALALGGVLYAALFGLGALAYRTLSIER